MRPKPFITESYSGDRRYVRETGTGLVWHRCEHRTLYADTDRSGVVYHANYLRYFELGRATLMRDAAYPYKEIESGGFVYPIIDLGMQFFKPLYYDDLMWMHTRPVDLERVRLKFDYAITLPETNELICTGFTRHCALNPSGKPVAVDEKTVQLWKTFPK